MAKFVIGVLVLLIGLVLLAAVLFRALENRSETKQQKLEQRHELRMEREQRNYEELMTALEDDEE